MSVTAFRGLNNVTDAMRLGAEWLVQANNVDVSNTGALRKRTGYSRTLAGSITGAYSTIDFTRLYLIDGGSLKAMAGTVATTLRTGLSTAPMHWTEVNDQVFFNNGVDSGVILPDNTVVPWAWTEPDAPVVRAVTGTLAPGLYQVRCTFTLADGRTTGSSDAAEIELTTGQALQISSIQQVAGQTTNVYIAPAGSTVFQWAGAPADTALTWNASPDSLGADLTEVLSDPLPAGTDIVQHWRGSMYAAQYVAADKQTVIWISRPLAFHLFNMNSDFVVVPGRVLMLAPHDDGLVIGTDQRIFAYDGKKLDELAPYGVVLGWHWSVDKERVLFWSTRGLCQFPAFANLTERQVSVAPGISAGGTVVLDGGQKRYLVSLKQGGSAFNSYP